MSKHHENSVRALRKKAPLFAALGDETRLTLVMKLTDGSLHSITDLTEGSTISRQAITRHLQVLQDVKLIRGVRQGRETLFALEKETIKEAKSAIDLISQEWDHALERLRLFVE
jgi:DNA-binding transcriptional ArsR family regulator